jgi:CelD/BcsL family acetyltransferase involved in cellulose biosynthesis
MIHSLIESRPEVSYSVITEEASLEKLRLEWIDLLKRSASDEPMLTPTWLLSWWRIFGSLQGRELKVGAFFEGERLVGLVPLLRRRHWYRPGIPFHRLEPLGTGENERDRVWSDYLNIIVEPGQEKTVVAHFVRALAEGAFGKWDELVWPGLDAESGVPCLVEQACQEAGLSARCAVNNAAPFIPLPKTWQAYLNQLSSSKRYFITRSLRDFESWAGPGIEVKLVTCREQLEEGKRILMALHNERWSGAGGIRAFRSAHFVAFHELVLPELLDQGALELIWLCVRGEPIVALYNLVWNGKIYFYQCGRKLGLPAHLRPGVVMHSMAIRQAIANGQREYDFLGDESQYKSKFALARRPLAELRVVRRPTSLREYSRRVADYGICRARAFRAAVQPARFGTRNVADK